MKSVPVIILSLLSLTACELLDPENDQKHDNVNAVRIEYLGATSGTYADLASFSLVNDSTASIQYFAYDRTSLHYSTEALADTGWAYLFWNWCGTGAEYFELKPGTAIEFKTFLPDSSCNWRVLVSITDMSLSRSYILRSESLVHTHP